MRGVHSQMSEPLKGHSKTFTLTLSVGRGRQAEARAKWSVRAELAARERRARGAELAVQKLSEGKRVPRPPPPPAPPSLSR